MLLTKEQILAAEDLPTEDVDVPEWGGAVRVRGLTGAERDALEVEMVSRSGRNVSVNIQNFRAKLVARTVIDEKGVLLFSTVDIGHLGEKSAAALQRVFDVSQRLSGLSSADVEELAKNWQIAQSDDSTSG